MARRVEIPSNLRLWLPTADQYQVTYYDETGRRLRQETTRCDAAGEWQGRTDRLKPLELAFVEIETPEETPHCCRASPP